MKLNLKVKISIILVIIVCVVVGVILGLKHKSRKDSRKSRVVSMERVDIKDTVPASATDANAIAIIPAKRRAVIFFIFLFSLKLFCNPLPYVNIIKSTC